MAQREMIFTKTATNGQLIEVHAHETLPGSWIAQLSIDGKYISGPSRPQALKTPKGDVTHFLGEKPAVGLTASEAAIITAELDARIAAWKATPAGVHYALRNERERLLAEYRGALDEQEAAFEHGHKSDGSSAWIAKKAAQPKIDAAREALAAFDLAHPEIAR